MYLRHGGYYYVKRGKWLHLGNDLPGALAEYAKIVSAKPTGGCDELLDRTLEKSKETIKPNTYLQYRLACQKLKPVLGEFSPSLVESNHIAAILDHHRDTPNMANRMLTFLRIAFSNGLTWGMCKGNPCYGVKRHVEKRRDRLLLDAEYDEIKGKASASLRVIMDVAYLTGQRIGDVLAIRLADIKPEGIYFQQAKTGKRLMVEMSPDMKHALERARGLYSNVRGLTLFHGRGGKPLSYYGVRSAFQRACKLALIEDATLHDIRAKAASDARRQGKDATALLGHSTQAQTVRYLRDKDHQVVSGPSIGKVQNSAA